MVTGVEIAAVVISAVSLGFSITQGISARQESRTRVRREEMEDVRKELDRVRTMHENCERARTALFAENVALMRRIITGKDDVEGP